jgi:hypothetical protein
MLHASTATPSIKRAIPRLVETPVFLREREHRICWGRPLRRQLALLLLDQEGVISGGFRDGKPLTAEQAQVQLVGPFWERVAEPAPGAWTAEVPELGEDEDE